MTGRSCRSVAVRVAAGEPRPAARWAVDVPSTMDPASARRRELSRPVDPRLGPRERTVLLRYADGSADLVVVSARAGARVPDRYAVPAWLRGDGGGGRVALDLPAGTAGDLVAALGLVLDRYGGPTHVGRLDEEVPGDGVPVAGVATVTDRPESTVECRPFLSPPWALSYAVDGEDVVCAYPPGVDPAAVARFNRHVAAARTEPDSIPTGDERRTILRLGGVGVRLPGPARPLHHVVAEVAARQPDAVAVGLGADRLTYRELDERSDRVAGGLRREGAGPGTHVGVCLERGCDLVAVLLGVLKAGAAYVPLDPVFPAERRAFVAADAGVAVVVGGPTGVPVSRLLDGPAGRVPDESTPDSPAYVIYTSGSTGQPKGVVVPHGNVTRLLAATRDGFGLGPYDVWTQFHSAAFDFSVWEIWGCLMTGGRLVLVPYGVSRAPERFAALLAAERVTVLSQTPSAFSQLSDVDIEHPVPASVRLVVFGGEPLDPAPLRPWFDRHPESTCRLVNMYGITETTVHVTALTLSRAGALAGTRSVGRPLPGWHVYVLDAYGRLAPLGVEGELYVGGYGVARGYLNRPELTAERFVADPYAPGLMYRTGDRGRLLPTGEVEHLGRLDDQVQLRGHRVEPGEVRARLLDAPGVRAAAVVPRLDAADPLGARLDAYVVGDVDSAEVRRHAERFLPDYMVPATLTVLPALPLTANGKVDTARLRPPDEHTGADGTGAGAVQAAWEQVFGIRVAPDDDFFALGGTSLLAVRLLDRLRAAGLALTVPQLYRHRTVRQLTALLATPEPG